MESKRKVSILRLKMEDLIALNKELSALIAELGGTPFSISIVDGRVVLPEELQVLPAEKIQSAEDPLTYQEDTVVEASQSTESRDRSEKQKSSSAKIQIQELNLDSKDQENISYSLISEKPSAPIDSCPTQENNSLAVCSKSSSIQENSSKESAKQTKIAETLNSSSESKFFLFLQKNIISRPFWIRDSCDNRQLRFRRAGSCSISSSC